MLERLEVFKSSANHTVNTIYSQGLTTMVDITANTEAEGTSYTHSTSINDFQQAIMDVLRDLTDKEVDGCLYSMMVDEATDISVKHCILIYIRYVYRGELVTKFIRVKELDSADAESITKTLLDVMSENKLIVKNCVCLGSDGASVFTGARSGVAVRLRAFNPYMSNIHCMAHRLALAVGKASDSFPYLVKYQEVTNALFKYFHYSPKYHTKLSHLQNILGESQRTMKQIFHTRWLSFSGAVAAIALSYDSILTCLVSDSDAGNPSAVGLLHSLKTYKFVEMTHFLADVMHFVSELSLKFQKRDVVFSSVKFDIEQTVTILTQLKSTPGSFQLKLGSLLHGTDSMDTETTFHGHTLNHDSKQRHELKLLKPAFIDKVIEHLNLRFPDIPLVSAFGIFQPANLPDNLADLSQYGCHELDLLIDRYGQESDLEDGTKIIPYIEKKAMIHNEWIALKSRMLCEFIGLSFESFASCMLSPVVVVLPDGSNSENYPNRECFPNLCKLIEIAWLFPMSTAEVERGVSAYNLSKTKLRNLLKIDTVNMLMYIRINGPPLAEFDFRKAYTHWKSQKMRKVFNYCKNK